MSDEAALATAKALAPPPGGVMVKRETGAGKFPCLFTMKMAQRKDGAASSR